ncbi:PREDICTED: acyltransferase-like protein At3g26840, chloroplastic isoform X2 [Tarenaya hassleriana]|uniref:acyltransferase-like protein At3g26840, chloroplastic isoform X2 n=1 Tax=Tarenaya hassleriana TaxID=28532 RepID=UPI0008FCFD19|nr:PREDICTED: acyltransferase-like protein At3g26840, chloroplastic isoform X2 [Tarenaya hassleriana]
MAATTPVSFPGGVSPVLSSLTGRVHNSHLVHWKSTLRLTSPSTNCLVVPRCGAEPPASFPTSAGRFRQEKDVENDSAVAAAAAENPYADADHARPEERKSLAEILEEVRGFVGSDGGGDGGPPRWFSPLECGARAPGSPLLLFLPGIDGTGLGLIRHHRRLGEMFDVWCLHIPVMDRTPVQDLVKLIERTVRSENHRYPDRPIYLVGESIGACLALDVAARNPNIDLVLILANPAVHFNSFMLQPLSGLLEFLPDGVSTLMDQIFGVKHGGPFRASIGSLANEFALQRIGGGLFGDLFAASALMPTLARIFTKDTLLWRLEMLKSASASANSHMNAVRAQTLILLSGPGHWLVNKEEIERRSQVLPRCEVRNFKENGHFLFLDDINLVTIIKGSSFYRRGKSHDYISDYFPPTPFEFKQQAERYRWIMDATSPVMLSTLENGKLVRGLEGLPSEGPVLYVGYHMLLGFELYPLVIQILKERNILLRGMAHPLMFRGKRASMLPELQAFDTIRLMGSVPVSHFNFYKLLQSKSHVLMYPGGAREALHRKGEEYKLFWPEHPEFVRTASRFGAKIVPFGVVGEDDLCEVVLDYNDQMKMPFLKDLIKELSNNTVRVRGDEGGELGNQDLYFPAMVPKIPGRFYYYFGKPIETAGKEEELRDKEKAQELYFHVKSEVENYMSYLKTKRESDPYRNLMSRLLYQASHGLSSLVQTFDL